VRVAIVGATGAVGRELKAVLEERAFPVRELRLLASARSAGGQIDGIEIHEATPDAFDNIDLALFSASSTVAKALAPAARERGAVVVDNSSAFRADPECPLVVPEINGETLGSHQGVHARIIANPNCSTILLSMALHPLRSLASIRRVVVCSYQAVSGAGADAMEELRTQEAAEARGEAPVAEVFPTVIAHNAMPWVGSMGADGYSEEESKVRSELRRIFTDPELPVAATCVRVPVWRAHAEAVHVELDRAVSPAAAADAFRDAPGIVLHESGFPTPRDVAGKDGVHIGRIRADRAFEPGLALWCVMDQLRKGAALNAIQIAETVLGVPARAQ
jgi:aspartate-semialdehyde dehydrogenase